MRIRSLAPAAVLASLLLAPGTAAAKPKIAVDGQAAIPLDAPGLSVGVAFSGRLGYEIALPMVQITPEVGGGYVGLGGLTLGRGFAGVRASLFEAVRPGAYAHVGYGGGGGGASGAAFDVGGFLDFSLVPLVDFGVHGGFASIDAAKWIEAGAHVALAF